MELFEYHAKRILHRFGVPFSTYEVKNTESSYAVSVQIDDGVVVVTCCRDGSGQLFREEVLEWRLFSFQIDRLIAQLNLVGQSADQFHAIAAGAVRAFFQLDATRIELSPIVVTETGSLEVVHTSVSIDSNALIRQPEISLFLQKVDNPYLELRGSVGCLANGLALGLATIDELQTQGSEAAGLFTIGGEFNETDLLAGFRYLADLKPVHTILAHIFTGLKDCEPIAVAIKREISTWKTHKPIAICFQGTNAAGGVRAFREKKRLLHASTLLLEAIKEVQACRS